MTQFESAFKELAQRKLRGIRISGERGVHSYDGFIRVGVTVNKDVLNKMVSGITEDILKAKYDILKRFVHYLAWISPVYTGYFVTNWQANPKWHQATTHVSQEPNSIGPYYSSGSMRRKMRKTGGEADAVKAQSEQRMMDALQSVFLSYEAVTNDVKTTWAFYNPTPYAGKVEETHQVMQKAIAQASSGA